MKDSTTIGLDPEIIASLLGIASNADISTDGPGSAEAVAQLLDAWLAAPVGTATLMNLYPVRNAGEAGRGRPSLRQVLTGPRSCLEMLRSIRQDAKREASKASSEVKQATATTVYFASIANALVFHNRKLTTHSDESLERSFDDLMQKPWMPKDLIELFSRAGGICRNRR